jgi:glycosyltransferase involved in cell wall biosynthesis
MPHKGFRKEVLMQLKVALIVGDNRTPFCGVKNYANSLAQALTEKGLTAHVVTSDNWSAKGALEFARRLKKESYDVVHVQYPSIGYRGSLFPHFLGVMNTAPASIATIHEYSALPHLHRMSTHLFRGTARKVIFCSQYELSLYNRNLHNLGSTQTVIPIGSNIPEAVSPDTRDTTVIYFGQIRPRKGIEQFIELARTSLESQRSFSFHILGSAPGAHQDYMRELQQNAPVGLTWSIDLGFAQVSEILARSFAAYLPFPDGVSERRGSMLAALTNGLPVLSTVSEATPAEMLPQFLPTANRHEALYVLDELAADPGRHAQLCTASRHHAACYAWSAIAARHVLVYQEALRVPNKELLYTQAE